MCSDIYLFIFFDISIFLNSLFCFFFLEEQFGKWKNNLNYPIEKWNNFISVEISIFLHLLLIIKKNKRRKTKTLIFSSLKFLRFFFFSEEEKKKRTNIQNKII